MKRGSVSLAMVVLFAAGAYAQLATTTALVGTVTDTSGQAIPAAAVTAINQGTGDTYHAVTNDQGYYNIQFVHVGTYNLIVEKQGFQKFEKRDIVVENNATVRNDATLAVGSITQEITIQATAPVIKTDDASVSENITTRDVANLPLNGRDPMHLAITTPGVIPGLKASNGVPPGEDFIGAGTREIQNEMSLDGISIMNNLITTTPSRPMVEAVQEVQVQTGTYSAQYGAYMGVHINMITKSGTNSLHGAVLEFVRNNFFDARPYFLPATAKQPPLHQNQFGFELDGPIIIPKLYNGRNKTFFMGSYEGLRQIRSTTSLATILTPQMFKGDFSQYPKQITNPFTGQPFPNNQIPANLISPYAQALQKYYPVPNLPGITNNLSASLANNNNTDQTVDRLDQNLGDNVRLFFRYQRQQETILVGAANPTSATSGPVYLSNYDIGYTHTLTPHIVNDMRFGRNYFNTATLNYFAVNGIANAGASLGIPAFNGDVIGTNPGLPEFNVTGFTGWGVSGTNWYQDDSTWQGTEQLSWNKGNHNIMAGFELRKLETGRAATNSSRGFFNFTGQYSGYAPADFLLGAPANLQTYAVQVRGLVAEWRDGFFVLDNWQVNPHLTVNYGLRYELPTVPYTVNGYATELNPQQTALVPSNPPVPGFKFTYPQHKDWAPRLGFAYRLSERTVFRGGAGIYYNPNQTNSQTFLNTNPPFTNYSTYTGVATGAPNLSLANPIGGPANPPPPVSNVITDNWDLKTPRMGQWSFGVEQALWRNAGLEVQYLGSHAYHLDRSYYNNTPYLPGPGSVQSRRPNQLFGSIRTINNDEISNYNGLSVVVRQRFTHGLQFLASYTWSHTLDVSSDSNGGGAPMNPYAWWLDYGNSNWDVRHRFVMSYVWEIPFFKGATGWVKNVLGNWEINGVSIMQTGFPFNVSNPTDSANTSAGGTYRPNLVHTPSANCGDGHLTNCIDASAFALPPLYSYGNAGRNLLYGPHLFTTDLSLFKNFQIREHARFELRLEAFNVTNSPEFSNPSATFNTAAFGTIGSTSIDNRDIQIGAKLVW